MEPKSPSKFKVSILGFSQNKRLRKVSIIVFVLLLLMIGACFTFRPAKGHNASKGSYYTVVVDCGSTGTRVNVYEWVSVGKSERGLPHLLHTYPDNSTKSSVWKSSCKYHCMQTEPGLDKFVSNSSGIRASLEPLIIWAEQMVPSEKHSKTPIFILATAGLRRLAIEDANQVLEDVEAFVKEHTFLHKKGWIRVLSGKEEAYYGWVALNYKMGSFGDLSKSPSLGLLDLGGSSLQVVVEVDYAKEDIHLVSSKRGFIEHKILAYSLSAFGLNEAFDRTVVMLSHTHEIRESMGGALELRHPCFGFDFVQNYTCHGCIGPSFPHQKKSTGQVQKTEDPSLYLVGEPNWEKCKILARAAAINSSRLDWSWPTDGVDFPRGLCSNNGSDMINLTEVAPGNTRFHALSGFFAVYDSLNLSPRANLTKIWEKGQHLCSRSWSESSTVSRNQYCFQVPYMASLIQDGLCLGDKEILFGPGDVTWTLGASLVEGQFMWSATTSSRISSLTLYKDVLSSPIFIFVLLLGLLLIVYFSQAKLPMLGKRRFTRGGVSPPSYILPKRRPN